MGKHRDFFIKTYREHSEAIYRHLLFRIFSAERAEELMQEAFLKFWEYLEGGNEIRNARALLYRMADHLIIDEKRKRSAESLDKMMEDDGFDPEYPGHIEIELAALYKEALRELRTLRDEEQKIFVMRYLDDLDPKEIAEITGTTANTVSVTLNRIIKKLREKLSNVA